MCIPHAVWSAARRLRGRNLTASHQVRAPRPRGASLPPFPPTPRGQQGASGAVPGALGPAAPHSILRRGGGSALPRARTRALQPRDVLGEPGESAWDSGKGFPRRTGGGRPHRAAARGKDAGAVTEGSGGGGAAGSGVKMKREQVKVPRGREAVSGSSERGAPLAGVHVVPRKANAWAGRASRVEVGSASGSKVAGPTRGTGGFPGRVARLLLFKEKPT